MIASHFSGGNSSIGETNWMPALLTSISTDPKVSWPSAIIFAISSGLDMSAGELTAFTLKSFSMLERSCSMSAGVPNPLITTLAPALAKARAHANPMPLVDPVTTADLPVSVPISNTPAVGRVEWMPWDAGTHGRASSRSRRIRLFRKVLLWMSSRSAAVDAIDRATAVGGGTDRTNSRGHRGSRSGTRDRTRMQHHTWPDNATGGIF